MLQDPPKSLSGPFYCPVTPAPSLTYQSPPSNLSWTAEWKRPHFFAMHIREKKRRVNTELRGEKSKQKRGIFLALLPCSLLFFRFSSYFCGKVTCAVFPPIFLQHRTSRFLFSQKLHRWNGSSLAKRPFLLLAASNQNNETIVYLTFLKEKNVKKNQRLFRQNSFFAMERHCFPGTGN